MFLSIFRFFLRLIVLVLSVFSILYFYVLGYKFEPNIGFIKTSNYSFENYSMLNKKIYIDNISYSLDNGRVVLINMFLNKSCSTIKVGHFTKFHCFDKKNNHIVYISDQYIRLYPTKNILFKNLDLIKDFDKNIKYTFFWNNIKFYYYKNGDIVYGDDISFKKLLKLPNAEFVGYDDNGLFLVRNGKLFYLKIKNNDYKW